VDALKRVEKKGDLFSPILTLKQSLKNALAAFAGGKPLKISKTRLKGTGDGSITAYNAKRDFTQTAEPSGKTKASGKKLLFCIQKHDASHLHYDFRLELDGVLKSWAVPKGPQTDMETKRLAMMVEDHPYDYARFEGTIPEGNYGAGTVMVWDIGTWENLGPEPHEGLKTGKLHFQLNGKKLNGEWALVKMHGPRATKGNEWLLLKHGTAMEPISANEDDKSAISGRTMEEISGPRSRQWTSGKKAAHPSSTPEKGSFKSRLAALAKVTASPKKSRKKVTKA
jgi:bifunctional non-homologous end joining protein LigD